MDGMWTRMELRSDLAGGTFRSCGSVLGDKGGEYGAEDWVSC